MLLSFTALCIAGDKRHDSSKKERTSWMYSFCFTRKLA